MIKIPANFNHNIKVKHYSCQLLSALIDYIWFHGLSITEFRNYKEVFAKAARDIEAVTPAGFLKLAYGATTVKTNIVQDQNFGRKVSSPYFVCHVVFIIRHKAAQPDIANYFAILSQIKEKVRYIYWREKMSC